MTILLVDDDRDDIGLFKEAVIRIDKTIDVIVGRNGEEALKLLQEITPDLIFLDINMPVMDGIKCLAAIRNDKSFDHIPVIMHSTAIRPEDIAYFQELKADYLTKPVDFSTLVVNLKDVIAKVREQK